MKHSWQELEDGSARCRRCPARTIDLSFDNLWKANPDYVVRVAPPLDGISKIKFSRLKQEDIIKCLPKK